MTDAILVVLADAPDGLEVVVTEGVHATSARRKKAWRGSLCMSDLELDVEHDVGVRLL